MGATGPSETFAHSITPLKKGDSVFLRSSAKRLPRYTASRYPEDGTDCFSKNVGRNKSSKFHFVTTSIKILYVRICLVVLISIRFMYGAIN